MKKILPILILASACRSNTNTLTGKTETLKLHYIAWGCTCANWATPEVLDKYNDDQGRLVDSLAEHCIFIEPATKALELPLYFDPGRHEIVVTGQFYKKPDYPIDTVKTDEQLDKARVFRYTNIKVSNRDTADYSPNKDTIVTLSYNAIGCTCAQWSYSSKDGDTSREFLYLEPASDKLINADSLYKGNNLPLQIQVTGQIITDDGYPTGFHPTKSIPKPGIVFRYTKIKVLGNGH